MRFRIEKDPVSLEDVVYACTSDGKIYKIDQDKLINAFKAEQEKKNKLSYSIESNEVTGQQTLYVTKLFENKTYRINENWLEKQISDNQVDASGGE